MERCHSVGSHQVVECRYSTLYNFSRLLYRATLRLFLLRITRRPLLSPPIPEREFDPTTLPPSSQESSPTLAPSSPASSPPATPDHLRNNHSPLPLHPLLSGSHMHADTSVQDYLLPKAMTTSSVKLPVSLIQTISSHQHWLGEIIYILRPLTYGMEHNGFMILILILCSLVARLRSSLGSSPCHTAHHGIHI